MTYKANIERIMKAKGISQVDLADVLGISSQAVNQWFNTPGGPKSARLPAIAKALGVPLSELMDGEDLEDGDVYDMPLSAMLGAAPEGVWKAVGSRLHFVRTARMMVNTPDVVAAIFGWEADDLLAYERGDRPAPLEGVVAFCHRFAVSPEFLLLGKVESLDDYLRVLYREK